MRETELTILFPTEKLEASVLLCGKKGWTSSGS